MKSSRRGKWPIVPRPVPGYNMGHWVGHNKYIETLLIWLRLIFIYLILQINKHILSDLQKKSRFSCTVCATKGRKIKHTSFIFTVPLPLLFRIKNMFSTFTAQKLLLEKTLVICTTKLQVDFFLWTVAKVNGWGLWLGYRRGRAEEMSKSQFILVKYMYIPSII